MRKTYLVALLLVAPILSGQDSMGGGLFQQSTRTIRFFSASPATCEQTRDNIGLNTTTDLLGWCSASNTWSYVASTSGATFTGPVLLANGNPTVPSLGFSSDSDGTGTGLFRSAANAIGFTTNGIERWIINASGALNPLVANTYDIGGTTTIRDIGIGRNAIFSGSTSGTSTLHAPAIAGTSDITLPNATSVLPIFTQQITFAGPTAARTVTLPDAAFTVARTDAGQTFTGSQTFVQNGNQTTQISVTNSEAAGTSAQSISSAVADVAIIDIRAHGSGRVATRFGVTLGGYAELLSTAGNGILIGTTGAKPVILGTSGTAAVTVDSSQVTDISKLKIGGNATITEHFSATASLDFTALAANTCEVFTITVTGAADGDTVTLGVPNALADVDGATERTTFFGWVSGADTVSVRRCNVTGTVTADPAAATVRADVWQH